MCSSLNNVHVGSSGNRSHLRYALVRNVAVTCADWRGCSMLWDAIACRRFDWSGWWGKTVDTFSGRKSDQYTESDFLVCRKKAGAGVTSLESYFLWHYMFGS